MVTFKIHGQKTNSIEENLCKTCKFAFIRRGAGESQEEILCRTLNDTKVPYRIAECTQYMHKNMAYLHEMESIAWVLQTKSAGRQVGFLSPQMRKEMKDVPPQ